MASTVETLFKDSAKTEALYPRSKVSAISDNSNVALSTLLNQKQDELIAGDGIDITSNTISLNIVKETKSLSFSNTGDVEIFPDERMVLMVCPHSSTDYAIGVPFFFYGKTYCKGFVIKTASFATNTTYDCDIYYLA